MSKAYKQLSYEERVIIALLYKEGVGVREISREVLRPPSTISRELRRNFLMPVSESHLSRNAQKRSDARRRIAHQRQRLKNQEIRRYVEEKLELKWSPEQIAGRLSSDCPGCSISHESIYQFIYTERRDLIPKLARSNRKRHRRPYKRRRRYPSIPQRIRIDQRPKCIDKRKEIGHWEVDTIFSRQGPSALLIMTERKTRLTKIRKLKDKTAAYTRKALVEHFSQYQGQLRKSITYDNGSENAEHHLVNDKLNMRSFFCNPYHSWEKGTVENTAGLIRRFFPKKTNFDTVSHQRIRQVEKLLNNRPRKCLNYKTPSELFTECCN